MPRIVLILGGGDWTDASVDDLLIPDSLDLEEVRKEWREMYNARVKKYEEIGILDKYTNFIDLLKSKGAEDAGLETFEDL